MAVTLRDLVLDFAQDGDWEDTMAATLTAAIHAELPQLSADEDLRAATLASTRSIVALFVQTVRREERLDRVVPPETAVAFARELVQRGLPLETLLRSYHVGHAAFFERWADEVRLALDDPRDVAQALQEAAVTTFAFVQALDSGLVTRWAAERERWVRSTVAEHAEIVRALLAGEEGGRDLDARLGYPLGGAHTAFVVWAADGSGAGRANLERAAAVITDSLDGGYNLVVPLSATVSAGWVARARGQAAGAQLPDDAMAAVGSPASGLAGFRTSHAEALDARRIARLTGRPKGSIVCFESVALLALAGTDLERARRFVASRLGDLAADGDAPRRLAATLRAYLEEGMSPRRTARRLGIHENTVGNRIRAVEELIGGPVEAEVAELLVALRLHSLTGPLDPTASPDARD